MTLHFDSREEQQQTPSRRTFAGMQQQQQQQQRQLVYEPQSNATPVKSAPLSAASAASDAQLSAVRRKRRSLFGARQSPMPKVKRKSTIERRACLTEILWEDVQKAKELLGLRQNCQRQPDERREECEPMPEHPVIARLTGQSRQQRRAVERCSFARQTGQAVDAESRRDTLTIHRRSRRHRRVSSENLDDSRQSSESVELCLSNVESPSRPRATPSTSPEHQRRVRRFWELRRIIRELVERKVEKDRQLDRLRAAERRLLSAAPDNLSSIVDQSLNSELCFPTQYLLAVREDQEEETAQSELQELQEEIAVQKAVVDANRRLLHECLSGRPGRLVKRRRAQDFQRAQEKLRTLHMRAAELRATEAAGQSSDFELKLSRCDSPLLPIDSSWSQSLGSLVASGGVKSAGASIAIGMSCGPSKSGSVDSGFQEMSGASSTASLTAATSHSSVPGWFGRGGVGNGVARQHRLSAASLKFIDDLRQGEHEPV